MKTLIEKLENRKKITEEALEELLKLVLELEKNIDKDITTSSTICKVSIKAEDYYVGEWLQADDAFSLLVENGKIKIKDIFTRIKKDENNEKYEIKLSHSFNYFSDKINEDRKIIKINFLELIKALEQLINLTCTEAQRIDNDAQEFIYFCENWKLNNESKILK